MVFERVFVAGTFDGMHKGHEAVLTRAFAVGEKITIGLTTDTFVRNLKSQISNIKYTNQIESRKSPLHIQPYVKRRAALEAWLKEKGYLRLAEIVPIDDPFEPAASARGVEALIVTRENKGRGMEINLMRKSRGIPPLVLLEVPMVEAQDRRAISSTRLRNGEIDRQGKLILPDSLRPVLAQPLGRVLTGEAIAGSFKKHQGKIIITVGDVATRTLLEAGVTPSLLVIDNKVSRKPYRGLYPWKKSILLQSVVVKSGPGYIARAAVAAITQWAKGRGKKRLVLDIDGEEDLLTLSAIVEAPVGSVIYYGQPEMALWGCGPVGTSGLVEVVVTEEKKREAKALLAQFSQSDKHDK